MQKFVLIITGFFICCNMLSAQDSHSLGTITGNFQVDGQYYKKDSLSGADAVAEKFRSNSWLNLNYVNGNFKAGLRYESYMPQLLGYDTRYKGNGIATRFVEFNNDIFDVTAGNFYDQFGSGMIFRAYEDKALGIDNAIDGIRIKIRPTEGIEIKGLVGKQRSFWSLSEGTIRGGDINVALSDVFKDLFSAGTQVNWGASMVSKYQTDQESFYNLPENVFAWSTRMSLATSVFNFDAEFAYKYNDPNATNKYSFNPGTGLNISASYFPKNMGISLTVHRVDNMDFRSDYAAKGQVAMLNYIPAISQQHPYSLTTMYPYSTQLNGEVGLLAEFTYTFDKDSYFGGKYPVMLDMTYSRVNSLDTSYSKDLRYKSPFFSTGNKLYYQDISLQIEKRWSPKFKSNFYMTNTIYDRDLMENEDLPHYGKVHSTVAVADLSFKLNSRHTLRTEFQHEWANQDSSIKVPDNKNGNWLSALVEYTIAPTWYFTVFDEYNYGNNDSDHKLHYINASVAYIHSATRIQIGYGRQRGGILCVGGVCRQVPAATGLSLSISSSF